jgi:protein-disulfide isomerase
LDRSRLDRCLQEDAKTRDIFERDRDLVRRLGFTGTPAFAVGRIERGNRLRVERVITGAVGPDVFTEVLDGMLEDVSERRAGF